jgi:hypothetical protein
MLPWIASLALHAALVLLPVGIFVALPPGVVQVAGVDVALVASPEAPAASGGSADAPGVASAAALPTPALRAGKVPPISAHRVSTETLRGVVALERPGAGAAAIPVPLPSVEDVLSDMPSASSETMTRAPAAAEDASQALGAQIVWRGSPRKVVRWRDPPLPAVLRRTGQEAECEAEITVAPSGAILHVEITKGSGYTDIDASVEAALRDNLFSRVSGRTDTIATVRYKFRPEKQD